VVLQHDKRLVAQTAVLLLRTGPQRDVAVPHARVPVEQRAPVARLRGLREVPLAEGLDAVVGDALRGGWVGEERLDLGGQVGEVALDLDEVLVRARGDQKVVVVLDILQLVRDDDGAAGLAVF